MGLVFSCSRRNVIDRLELPCTGPRTVVWQEPVTVALCQSIDHEQALLRAQPMLLQMEISAVGVDFRGSKQVLGLPQGARKTPRR